MIQEVGRQAQITVSVPKQQLWQFLEQFGMKFSLLGGDDLGREFVALRQVESYEEDPRTPDNSWVTVRLHPVEVSKFTEFCNSFPSTAEELYGKNPKSPNLGDAVTKGEEAQQCPVCGHETVRQGTVCRCLNCGRLSEAKRPLG